MIKNNENDVLCLKALMNVGTVNKDIYKVYICNIQDVKCGCVKMCPYVGCQMYMCTQGP